VFWQTCLSSLRAGASAFLLKDAKEDQPLAAILVTAQGGSLFAPAVTARLIERFCSHEGTDGTLTRGAADAGLPALHTRIRVDEDVITPRLCAQIDAASSRPP
jgi:DNA-binding NarL/FixJ family response regulator